MWLTRSERTSLALLGALSLVGLGVLLWQGQRPPLLIEVAVLPAQATPWDEALEDARRIDVNTADVAQLERLPGVGPTLASRIVAHREQHGRFGAPEEITHVKGIGPKTYETLKDYLTTE